MTTQPSEVELSLVFGEESTGDTIRQRAASSSVEFVRSRVQLVRMRAGATGRVFTAAEALREFGWQALWEASSEGSYVLIDAHDEPAASLRSRREDLGIGVEDLRKRLHLEKGEVERAETLGVESPIRVIERIAQSLSLNERQLGSKKPLGDTELGVRLRELRNTPRIGFTSGFVLNLSEAAWVIAREDYLRSQLPSEAALFDLPDWSYDFHPKPYVAGYRLARETRKILQLDELEPIESVRKIIEIDFGIPLVQMTMPAKFAGATIGNGGKRGIVINDSGLNQNVTTRRLTMCHELGHLLWDPDNRLERVKVDEYREVESPHHSRNHDEVEARANAFAVEFLAPSDSVRKIWNEKKDARATVMEVVERFGISVAAARHHVKNTIDVDMPTVRAEGSAELNVDLIARENLILDFHPIGQVPLSRRGRFSLYVAKLVQSRELSLDSAAMQLGISRDLVDDDRIGAIVELLDVEKSGVDPGRVRPSIPR